LSYGGRELTKPLVAESYFPRPGIVGVATPRVNDHLDAKHA